MEIIAKLNGAIVVALKDPGMLERTRGLGAIPMPFTPTAFARHIRSEYEKWATIVAQWRTGRRAPVRLESIISRLSIIERFAISAPIPGQHNVGCGQEPKRILTYKWNVDEYRNQCEPGDDE